MTYNEKRHKGFPVKVVVVGTVLVAALGAFVALEPEQRVVVSPIYAIVAIPALLIAALWKRDELPPYFDIGVFCVVVTSIYLSYPLLAFLVSGLAWTPLSDSRLVAYAATPSEFARVGWWGALYLLSLATTYALVRRHPAANVATGLVVPNKRTILSMVVLFLAILIYVQLLQVVYGVDLNPTYGSEGPTGASLPLFVQQVTGKLVGIGIVLEFGLILLLVSRSDSPVWCWTLRAWAVFTVLSALAVLGARSSVIFFLLAWLLAHQRLRRPLRPLLLIAVAGAVMAGAVLYGIVRDVGSQADTILVAASAGGEFQAMYGTAYNLIMLRDTGGLPDIPWGLYLADLLRLIPQQILPFEKMDPSEWYLELIGARDSDVGLMFGVISEAAIGLGAIEMVLRGIVLGLVFGEMHNWYSRHASRFWPTLFYLWLCVWSYYTYRASTFYLLGHVVFIFVPAYVLVRFVSSIYPSAKFDPRRQLAA